MIENSLLNLLMKICPKLFSDLDEKIE